ncbi:MAG: DUF2155 domain-containing protein [Pseudomonadota bacterium]
MRSGALAVLIAVGLGLPAGAQINETAPSDGSRARIQVDTSPLPRARTLRPPSDNEDDTRLPNTEASTGESAGIETRPVDDLTATAPDADTDATEDAARDATSGEEDPTGPVAVRRPSPLERSDGEAAATPDAPAADADADADAGQAGGETTGDVATDGSPGTTGRIALRPDPDEDDASAEDANAEDDEAGEGETGKTRWQRARARRFRLAPKTPGRLTVNTPPPIVPIATISTELRSGARLRQLDKMTGQTETFEIAIGESRRIARLQVELDACRAPGDNATSGTMAFVKVWDTKQGDDPEPEFTGWMFADSPALSALDHPRYDLWVINCTTSSAPESASNE